MATPETAHGLLAPGGDPLTAVDVPIDLVGFVCPCCRDECDIELMYVIDGHDSGPRFVCDDCFRHDYARCGHCGVSLHWSKAAHWSRDGMAVCRACFPAHWFVCRSCQETRRSWDRVPDGSRRNVCLKCEPL